jgi:hypothetical protein
VGKTEKQMLYIILGMIAVFTAIFIVIAYVPSESFSWMFPDPDKMTDEERAESEKDPHER